MTECPPNAIAEPAVKRRNVEANFSGGDIAGNAGIPLAGRVDQTPGLTRAASRSMGYEPQVICVARRAAITTWKNS
jgi:hypothetical protein